MSKYYMEVKNGVGRSFLFSESDGVTPFTNFDLVEVENEDSNFTGFTYNKDTKEWSKPKDLYKSQRKEAYDALNQFEMQFDDKVNGSTTWVDAITEIKAQFPKL